MNVLVDKFPSKVRIDGKLYELNTDYRICLKIMFAFEDESLASQEKLMVMIKLLYREIPRDLQKAIDLAIKFLDCSETKTKDEGNHMSQRLFSWEQDAKYIYSAIKQSHGVDLEVTEHLHWWKFVFMFLDLSENCFFNRLVGLRDKQKKGKLSKEEKAYIAMNKTIVNLSVALTAEEQLKVAKFKALLGKGGDG